LNSITTTALILAPSIPGACAPTRHAIVDPGQLDRPQLQLGLDLASLGLLLPPTLLASDLDLVPEVVDPEGEEGDAASTVSRIFIGVAGAPLRGWCSTL